MLQKKRTEDERLEESKRLVTLFSGSENQLLHYLSGQFSVLKTHAQMLMGLSGLTITVTGFSGHHMVRGGTFASLLLGIGLLCILIAISLTIGTLAKLRWVSQDLQDDLAQMVMEVICRRDAEQRQVSRAGFFVILGLGAYLASVAIAAFSQGLA